MKIRTLSAPTGAGKTFATSEFAVEQADAGLNILIVQPSVILIEQTKAQILKLNPDANLSVYHAEDKTDAAVVPRILEKFKNTGKGDGEILIITHAGFGRTPYFDDKQQWILCYDEAPAVEYSETFRLSHNGKWLLDLFTTKEDGHQDYYSIVSKSKKKSGEVAKTGFEDVIHDIFADIAAKLNSPYHKLYVAKEQYHNFSKHVEDKSENGEKQLTIYGVLSPEIFEGWQSVMVLGANLETSMMQKYWSKKYGVTFHQATRLEQKLRYTEHNNGHLIDVYYFMKKSWSKRKRKLVVAGSTLHDRMARATMELFDGQPHVFMENVGYDPYATFSEKGKESLGKYEKLPNVSHGLNGYQSYKNVVIYSALNPTPGHFKFLEQIAGVNADDVRISLYHEAIYQAAGRTAIRDINNTQRIKVVVADIDSAVSFSKKYPGSSVHPLTKTDIDLLVSESKKAYAQPKKWATNAEKQKAYRNRQKDR